MGENPNEPGAESIVKAYETIYLLKWLFPDTTAKQYREKLQELKHGKFPKFHKHFILGATESEKGKSTDQSKRRAKASQSSTASTSYWDRFEVLDGLEESELDELIGNEDSDDDDIEMKDLEGRGGLNLDDEEQFNDEGMLNDEIEDIESDDEQLVAY